MTRFFKVKINDVEYVAEVEEITGESNATETGATEAVEAKPSAKAESKPAVKAQKSAASKSGAGRVKVNSPLQGTVVGIKAAVGDKVENSQQIVVIEAMKMEYEIVAPEAGVIKSIDVQKGAAVEEGDTLFTID